jgi:hypothetical protein
MLGDKLLIALNFSLVIIAGILLLSLFDIGISPTGRATYDPSEMLCVVNFKENYNSWEDIDSCCLEVRKQLSCVKDKGYYTDKTVEWRCGTGPLNYWLSDETYNYCKEQVIW